MTSKQESAVNKNKLDHDFAQKYKADFPILNQQINGKDLVYFDNAATTQKPEAVLEAVNNYNRTINANPHRGAHTLSVRATEAYENARAKVSNFINAEKAEEIIFTRNTTESLNLLANSLEAVVEEGDEILISVLEHHSNILPWQQLAERKNLNLKFLYPDQSYRIPLSELKEKLTDKTKILSISQMSNVSGVINPVKEMAELAHQKDALVVVDGAQGAPHIKTDVRDLNADFYAFSGHKMLAPMGIGVLYGKKDLLEELPPFLKGGGMIEYVKEQGSTYAPLPEKFEAGTPNVEGAVGLQAAIEYLEEIGLDKIKEHELELTAYALEKMKQLDYVEIAGPLNLENRGGIISFNIKDVHSHDLATIVDSEGIAIRSGHHCAQPLMNYYQINSTGRISFYLYNTKAEVDRFLEALEKVREVFGYGS
ncbi:cysteine desulfurase [Halanaerobium saccharolyticum]|uniref:cysteine desulfurase n=1 Tax=Halanaerobium saccharolyticum TaxID=43595 RepID=A0A4R7YTR8_9FIRM|nr:cysteine desulfurase [Halanaerobium saccharolyticum]RAK06657.1 cysteine desulfurase [Halanaerobium saccharolyticum]TDW01196.1 cysteine desulfurase [Halanaerobium saccharolyticum]TDX51448.1 cysteine desulfurase [Halanaerobium saccharolyticum]